MPTVNCSHSPVARLSLWQCENCGETRHSCAHTCLDLAPAQRYTWLAARARLFRGWGRDRIGFEHAPESLTTRLGCWIVRFDLAMDDQIVCNDCGQFTSDRLDVLNRYCRICHRFHVEVQWLDVSAAASAGPPGPAAAPDPP